jgi:hypothetical protein
VIEGGPAISAETAKRISCDASVVAALFGRSRTLELGAKSRVIPRRMRRALGTRDGGCRFPGCQQRRFIDAHHIRHWSAGGETKLSNLLLLCRFHHRLIHEGGFGLGRTASGVLWFYRPDGSRIEEVPRPPRGESDLARIHRSANRGVAKDACICRGDGRMDYALAVDGWLSLERQEVPG